MTAAVALQRRALTAGQLLVAIWGASFTIQKAAYAAMGPGAFLFCRSLAMALCALILLRWRGRWAWPLLAAPEWHALLLGTAAGPLLHVVLVTYGIHWSTPMSSALILACGPLFTLILLRMIRRAPLQREQLAGVAIAFVGVLVFLSDKVVHADLRASGGDLVMLLAAVVFALHTIWVTPLVERHGGIEVMCWSTLLAMPPMLLLTAWPAARADFATITPAVWAAFAWTVLVAALAGWILWAWVNAVRGIARTAPLLYLVPPVAGFVGWATIGESLATTKLVGAAVTLAGVALAQSSRHRVAAASRGGQAQAREENVPR